MQQPINLTSCSDFLSPITPPPSKIAGPEYGYHDNEATLALINSKVTIAMISDITRWMADKYGAVLEEVSPESDYYHSEWHWHLPTGVTVRCEVRHDKQQWNRSSKLRICFTGTRSSKWSSEGVSFKGWDIGDVEQAEIYEYLDKLIPDIARVAVEQAAEAEQLANWQAVLKGVQADYPELPNILMRATRKGIVLESIRLNEVQMRAVLKALAETA